MARLLGIDVGTSGCKAIVIDESGAVLRQSSANYPLSIPRPTWSEQDPEEWWHGVRQCLEDVDFRGVDAIGLTGQMHGAVFLDEDNEVIRPAILWNDQRTVAECEEIDLEVGAAAVRSITCNPPLTGFQLPKLLWLRKHEPENFAWLRTVLLPKDYIRLKLTGQKISDFSDASGTGLLDVAQRKWSSTMADALDIDLGLFPQCAESFVITGKTEGGIPVVGGAGDQAAGAVGTGAVQPGIVSVSLGTSGVVFAALDSPDVDPSGALHTFCHATGRWHAMGVMLACGGALNWYAKSIQNRPVGQVLEDAETAEPGSNGVTFLPYLSGERSPHNDPHATAAWAGLNLFHGAAEMGRAIVEGVTFGLLDSFDRLKALAPQVDEIRITGGGAKSAFWVQMIADVFNVPCATLESDEGPAFGAALLAGIGIGVWPSLKEACQEAVKIRQITQPSGTDYSAAGRRFRSLYPALRDWSGAESHS